MQLYRIRQHLTSLVEHTQGTLLIAARTVLSEAKLPAKYWDNALKHLIQCKNSVKPSTTCKIPLTKLYCFVNENVKQFGRLDVEFKQPQ